MTSTASATSRRSLPWSWIWLLVGAALLPFTNLQTLVPVASWLAPVFLLRFSRGHRLRVAVPALIVVMTATVAVGMRNGFFPIAGGVEYVVFVIGLGLFGTVPYVVDHLLAPRLGALPRTLVFPAAVTTVELLGTIGNPFGTAGSTAYSQYASLPLMQLASVTGIWGLTFLVCWLAPVINEIWEHGFAGRGVKRATGVFVVALLTVMIFGGVRLAFAGTATNEVRVAALAPDRELNDRAFAERGDLAPVLDELFSRSAAEAQAGAKIIAWSEAAAIVREADMRGVMNRAADLADTENVYLQLSMIVDLTTPAGNGDVNENHAMLFGPDGDVLWDYLKSKPTPGDGHSAGPGHIPDVDTPYGRLATVICQDDFFPSLLRQAGRKDVDILLLPSSDWEAITDWHAQQAAFRAVENGTALVRPTRKGISLATDSLGRTVGQKSDYFTGGDHTLVTSVPIKGRDTVYSIVGDTFGYVCVAGLLVLSGWAVRRRMTSERTPSA